MDPIKLQQDIRHNQEDLQNYMRDFRSWTDQIKKKDEALNAKSKTEKDATQTVTPQDQGTGDCKKSDTRKESPVSDADGQRKKLATPRTPSEEVVKLKEAGNECLKKQEYDKAIKHYTRALELDPNYHILYANRGMAYLKMSLFEEAEEDCGKAVELDPQYIKGYLRRGSARLELGKLQPAKQDFQTVLKLEPHNSQAKMNIERIKLEEAKQARISAAGGKGDGHLKAEPVNKHVKASPTVKAPHLRSKKSLRKIEVVQVQTDKELEDFLERGTLSPDVSAASSEASKAGADSPDGGLSNPANVSDESAKQTSLEHETSNISRASPSEVVEVPSSKASEEIPTSPDATLPPPCRSSYEFLRDWKTLRAHSELRRRYLRQIPPDRYGVVFGQSLEEEVLVEMLREAGTLSAAEAARLLSGLSRVKRMDVLVMFMAAKEKTLLKELLRRCEEEKQDMSEVRKSFGL